MKMIAKHVLPILWIALLPISLCSCSDYGYEFHYAVIGGNGNITASYDQTILEGELCSENQLCELNCPEGSHIFRLLGGKNTTYNVLFTAEPDDGYKVKQWLFNHEVVSGNKTNTFVPIVNSSTLYRGIIAVEFEPAVE